MTTGASTRRRLGALAMLTATLTAAAGATLGGSGGHLYGAGAYLVIAVAALFSPAAIAGQVIVGQVLVGSVLLAREGPGLLPLLPMVAGVVVTAELLAVVARVDTPLERDPAGDLHRAGRAAVVGGGVFGVVMLVGELPGPTGLAALALASGACVAVAVVFVVYAREGRR